MVRAALAFVAAIAIASAMGGGGRKKKKKTSKVEPAPPLDPPYVEVDPSQRPLSNRMTFDQGCWDLAVRVNLVEYDIRITNMYWDLRSAGVTDPEEIAAEILRADSPHCEWPAVPGEGASPKRAEIGNYIFQAVELFRNHEIGGTLGDYAGILGAGGILE